jgi:hypothetical protein
MCIRGWQSRNNAMAHLNYQNGSALLAGGVTQDYFLHPMDARYNDVWIAPDPASNANGNVQITAKWCIASPQEIQLWFRAVNNSSTPVWFAWNTINVTP